MKARDFTKLFMGLVAISFLNVACQGNLSSDSQQTEKAVNANGVGDSNTTEPAKSPEDVAAKIDLKAVQSTVDESKVAMDEARAILAKFSNPNGSIKLWSLLTSSSSSVQSQSIFIIYEKLSEVLDKVYQKVAVVKDKFNKARAVLAVEAAKLDPLRPDHQMVLAQINQMMSQIDRAESQFSMALGQLAGQLDLVNNGIDMLSSSAGGLFPGAGIIVSMLTNQVKMAITEFQTKLRSL
ncbi:hypothetical protein GW916_00470 [bacterium]|nr:hypothetical protein [bacterium]